MRARIALRASQPSDAACVGRLLDDLNLRQLVAAFLEVARPAGSSPVLRGLVFLDLEEPVHHLLVPGGGGGKRDRLTANAGVWLGAGAVVRAGLCDWRPSKCKGLYGAPAGRFLDVSGWVGVRR